MDEEEKLDAHLFILWLAMLLVGIVTVVVLLLYPTTARGAPAPRARQRPPAPISVVGTWTVQWGGCQGTVTFRPDGSLVGDWGGPWTGSWRVAGSRLEVCERPAFQSRLPWCVWRADMAPCGRRGKLLPPWAGKLRLEPLGRVP